MKLFKGGIPADIMVSYVNNSPLSFYLSADNIISLQQQGVPGPVLTAMIHRYGELQRQAGMAAGAPAQAQGVPAQAPAPQYYSYSAEDQAAANFNAALQARQALTYAYVAPPNYGIYPLPPSITIRTITILFIPLGIPSAGRWSLILASVMAADTGTAGLDTAVWREWWGCGHGGGFGGVGGHGGGGGHR